MARGVCGRLGKVQPVGPSKTFMAASGANMSDCQTMARTMCFRATRVVKPLAFVARLFDRWNTVVFTEEGEHMQTPLDKGCT
jgi:hypothetical protein